MNATEKSKGHLRFWDSSEFFARDGEVYRAPISAPLADGGHSRHGRWECSITMWEKFGAVIYPERQP